MKKTRLILLNRFIRRNYKTLPVLAIYSVVMTVAVLGVHVYRAQPAYAPSAENGSSATKWYGAVLSGTSIEKQQAAQAAAAAAAANTAAALAAAKPVPAAVPVSQLQSASSAVGFGISFGDTLPWLSTSELDAELKDTAALGFKWVRMDFDWKNIQPDSVSSYDWSDHDRAVKAAAKYNLKVLGLITYTPAWARPASCSDVKCAPAHNSQFATFAGAVATHYATHGVQNWEIWNEPNLQGSWLPSPSASSYADLLKQSYTAIKKFTPNATVISGALSSVDEASGSINQLTFLKEMYTAGAKGSFDALGYHSYSYPATPDEVHSWNGWSMMNALPTSLHSIMAANGDGSKKIWSTEYGAPTNGPGYRATESGYDPEAGNYYVSEGLQAKMATQAVNDTKTSAWAGPLFWYSYKDIGTDASSNENFFGILHFDGTKKLVYSTFQNILK